MELFSSATPAYEPLASRMRPRNLKEYIGQEHILGQGRLLRRAIESDQLTSVLFYGPPGTGKTTLAQVIAATTKGVFLSLNAVLTGVKDIRDLIEQAKDIRNYQGKKTILFVDEVHRWNKAQQDALLPWVENGTFLLIGATTENPFFEVNPALVSRSRVFQLRALEEEDLYQIALQALKDKERGYGQFQIDWEQGALEHIVKVSGGDARSLLNALELAVETSIHPYPPEKGSKIYVSLQCAEESIQRRVVLYDKDGDYHFDTISAFIKSIRGSDPDATLYWLAKMIRAGEDPKFILRRMIISASEDIGLADPHALPLAVAAFEAFERIGMPEGQFALSETALYLATCPKSNSTMGYFEALNSIEKEKSFEIPNNLKDASRDSKALGHGHGYLYPHAYRDHWVAQRYLPQELAGKVFYEPGEQGYEKNIKDQVHQKREILLSLENQEEEENLTFGEDNLTPWLKRLGRGTTPWEEQLRQSFFDQAHIQRHHRLWVASDKSGLLLPQALRSAPEGQVWASLSEQDTQPVFFEKWPDLHKPVIMRLGRGVMDSNENLGQGLDRIFYWRLPKEEIDFSKILTVLGPEGILILGHSNQEDGQRLSGLIPPTLLDLQSFKELQTLEEEYFQTLSSSSLDLEFAIHPFQAQEHRTIHPKEWERWWDPARPQGFGASLIQNGLNPQIIEKILKNPPEGEVGWKKSWSILVYQKKTLS